MDRTACPAAQVLKRDKEDVDARYDRAMLYADMGESRKATEGLEQVGGGVAGGWAGGWVMGGRLPGLLPCCLAVWLASMQAHLRRALACSAPHRPASPPALPPPPPRLLPRHPAPRPVQVRSMRPEHSEAPKALARLYHRAGQAGQAAQVLQTHINSYPGQVGRGGLGGGGGWREFGWVGWWVGGCWAALLLLQQGRAQPQSVAFLTNATAVPPPPLDRPHPRQHPCRAVLRRRAVGRRADAGGCGFGKASQTAAAAAAVAGLPDRDARLVWRAKLAERATAVAHACAPTHKPASLLGWVPLSCLRSVLPSRCAVAAALAQMSPRSAPRPLPPRLCQVQYAETLLLPPTCARCNSLRTSCLLATRSCLSI